MGKAEQTRNLIIEKSLPIFNTKGYASTSISDITSATGITKGAIYGNFENKDAVAMAAFDYATGMIMGELREVIRKAPTAPLKLKAIAAYYSEYTTKPPIQGGCPIINTAIEADDTHPELRAKVIRNISLIKDTLRKIIERGIHEGQLIKLKDVEEFSNTFFATIEGAILISRVEGDDRTYKIVLKRLYQGIDQITVK